MVWRAKYSAMGASTARRTASSALLGDQVDQSWASSAAPSTPASATRRVMSVKLGTRALPPRSPKDTNPSFVGQISRVRPMLAPRRTPRNPVWGKRAGVPMFATKTVSCMERSTRWGWAVQRAVKAANAASGPVCA